MGRALAKRLNANLAIADKRRTGADASEVMNIIGEVKGSDIIILDDIISTAGTITTAAEALKTAGAGKIIAAATHPVLSGKAIERLEKSCIEEVVVTNSIPLNGKEKCKKIKVLDVSALLGEAILRIHNDESISMLFI